MYISRMLHWGLNMHFLCLQSRFVSPLTDSVYFVPSEQRAYNMNVRFYYVRVRLSSRVSQCQGSQYTQ